MQFHRAFGVYGIIGDNTGLVVIKKNAGPYVNRYDLPGGSLEDGEPLNHAIIREIMEETGLKVQSATQLGTTSFRYPWKFEDWTMNQHVAVFYKITQTTGNIAETVSQFDGQDSMGAKWMALDELNLGNASPLVLKAKAFLEGDTFDPADTTYDTWQVLTTPHY